MNVYTPMVDPHPGTRYEPSNGCEGDAFICEWCGTCQKDRPMRDGVDFDSCDPSEVCEIIAASFRGEAVEWRELEDGQTLCVAYVPAGTPIPAARDERQMELFANSGQPNV